GWVDTQADLGPEREVALDRDAKAMCDRIQATIAGGHRVWLVADSISPGPDGPRSEINQRLFDAVARKRYAITPADSQVGLFQVHGVAP
ncbi:MAG: hypothetical protein IID43_02500, partial [Planctomycetes bacterium]|nr:hypothetical protein [Planctomycetota bacterium]